MKLLYWISINFNHQLNKGHMHNIYGCDVNFVISCVWSILYDVIITILFWDQWELNYWSQLIKIYFKIYFNISCLGMKFAKRFNYQCEWNKKLVKKIIEGLETSKHDHVKGILFYCDWLQSDNNDNTILYNTILIHLWQKVYIS